MRFAPAALVLVSCLACQASAPSQAPRFRSLERGNHSGIALEGLHTARSEAEWLALWARHTARRLPPAPAPRVDFSSEMVVLVSGGERPSAGWALAVRALRLEPGELVIEAREEAPDPARLHAQVLTQPFECIALPHTELALRLERVPSH